MDVQLDITDFLVCNDA